MNQVQLPKQTPLQIWLMAARPKTLPAAAAPVIVGAATAFVEGGFHLPSALAALLGALLLQIGANLANDLFDFKKGADTHARLGPTRVTQADLLTPQQVARGMWLTFALAALVGLYLVWRGGLPIVIIGVTAILSTLAYTGGPYPLGYNGLGDVFVFIYFGLAAVGGTHYVQTGSLSPLAVWAAIPPGLLIVGILVVNNLRDIETNRAAEKHTLAVRFGARGARGGEQVEFFVGGIGPTGSYLDSIQPKISLGWVTLTTEWQMYRIPLTNANLTDVIGGFGWVSNREKSPQSITFYVDDVQFVRAP